MIYICNIRSTFCKLTKLTQYRAVPKWLNLDGKIQSIMPFWQSSGHQPIRCFSRRIIKQLLYFHNHLFFCLFPLFCSFSLFLSFFDTFSLKKETHPARTSGNWCFYWKISLDNFMQFPGYKYRDQKK